MISERPTESKSTVYAEQSIFGTAEAPQPSWMHGEYHDPPPAYWGDENPPHRPHPSQPAQPLNTPRSGGYAQLLPAPSSNPAPSASSSPNGSSLSSALRRLTNYSPAEPWHSTHSPLAESQAAEQDRRRGAIGGRREWEGDMRGGRGRLDAGGVGWGSEGDGGQRYEQGECWRRQLSSPQFQRRDDQSSSDFGARGVRQQPGDLSSLLTALQGTKIGGRLGRRVEKLGTRLEKRLG